MLSCLRIGNELDKSSITLWIRDEDETMCISESWRGNGWVGSIKVRAYQSIWSIY